MAHINPAISGADRAAIDRAITDASGLVIQTYESDEFGVHTGGQGSLSQPFGYTGEQRDPESGFVYLRARTYDPATGRFLQRDPWACSECDRTRPSDLHLYAYVENNPVNRVDPTGMKSLKLIDPPGPTEDGQPKWCFWVWTPPWGVRQVCMPVPAFLAPARKGICVATGQLDGPWELAHCHPRLGKTYTGTASGSIVGGNESPACKAAERAAYDAMNSDLGRGCGCYLRHFQYAISR